MSLWPDILEIGMASKSREVETRSTLRRADRPRDGRARGRNACNLGASNGKVPYMQTLFGSRSRTVGPMGVKPSALSAYWPGLTGNVKNGVLGPMGRIWTPPKLIFHCVSHATLKCRFSARCAQRAWKGGVESTESGVYL